MPNWCENNLLIKADGKDALDDFKRLERLLNETLKYDSEGESIENLLDSIISFPEVLRGTTEKEPYKLEDGTTIWWYEWCINTWGTKWEASNCIAYIRENRMRFSFLTANTPPINWLEKVGSLFPNLWIKLDYNEPGMCFRGTASGRGEIIDEYEEYE
tara:strand:- start:6467 stop:6940 length:474 start_codon:yes stop_codon:yes gene_type:complete